MRKFHVATLSKLWLVTEAESQKMVLANSRQNQLEKGAILGNQASLKQAVGLLKSKKSPMAELLIPCPRVETCEPVNGDAGSPAAIAATTDLALMCRSLQKSMKCY